MMESPAETEKPVEQTVKTEDDAKVFVGHFMGSRYYLDSFELFFRSKKLAPDVTEEEKKEAFLGSDEAKIALIKYAQEVETFKYSPKKFSQSVQFAARTYIKSTEDFFKIYREGIDDRDQLKALDSLRYQYHNALAEQLFQGGYVPSVKLGRGLARLFLIDKGLDNYDNASIKDSDRLFYVLQSVEGS